MGSTARSRRTSALALSLLLLGGLVCLSAPAVAQQRTFGEVMAEAVKARDAGELGRVVELLREAYELQPNPALLNNMGKILEQMGRYRDAIDTYQRVADDPSADASLRTLDVARIGALTPKLGKAWVIANVAPSDASLLVDGAPPSAPFGREFSLPQGSHALELTVKGSSRVLLRFVEFPIDSRTTVDLDFKKPGPRIGLVDVRDVEPAVTSILIRDYLVRADLGTLTGIGLDAGTYPVEVERAGVAKSKIEVRVHAGKATRLADVLPAPTVKVPKSAVETPPASAEVSTTAPAAPSDDGPGIMPWIVAGGGVVAAGAGGLFLMMAESDRDKVRNPVYDETNTVIISPTPDEARTLESNANSKATLGAALAGVGTLAIAGGIVWWAMAPDGSDGAMARPRFLLSPSGFSLQGRF